uniref:glycosyltransferase family 2 protein n=1 Tax=Paraclostridium bifermentans TaxID=1490 RepID=UPI00374E71A3
MCNISIIVAAYNVEMYIEKCIRSLIKQTFSNIEIVVVNDGSTDRTSDILKKYSTIDNRIRTINKKNEGLIEARKTGLKIASGKYIMFIDGDDWLKKDACELLYDKAINYNLDIVYYNLVFAIGKRLKQNNIHDFGIIKGQQYLKLVLTNKIRANAVLQFIRREFLIENNIKFIQGVTYAEDLAITVSLAINNPKVGCINQALYYYYQRPDSITKIVDKRVFDVEKVINTIEVYLIDRDLYNKYKEEFNFLSYLHLYYYRIVDIDLVKEIHLEIFKRWKKRNLNMRDNKYYQSFIQDLSILN